MKLSNQTGSLSATFGEERAVRILMEAGFDAVDFSCMDVLDDSSPKMRADYWNYVKNLHAIVEDAGGYFNQSHAPFPTSMPNDPAFDQKVFERILRAMEVASLAGARNIVVHPKCHIRYQDNPAYLKELNCEFYTSLIPYCKDMNICVAMENLWAYDENFRGAPLCPCGTPEEYNEYLDLVDSPWIVACLDIGHAQLCKQDVPAFIHSLMPRLKAVHVHESAFERDFHLLPYATGEMDWDSILKAFADSGYDGELTFETDNSLNLVPPEFKPVTAAYMAEMGHILTDKVEYYRSLSQK